MSDTRKNGSVWKRTGILCMACGSNASKVVDSRELPGGIRRRRECVKCGSRWTTHETAGQFAPAKRGRG